MTGKNGAIDYVVGLYHFEETGKNFQSNTRFHNSDNGTFFLKQKMDSEAIYANVGYAVSEQLRIAAGIRHTKDDKSATAELFGFITESDSHDWSETSWDVSASYKFNDRMTMYGTVQSGYQSGQYPARPYCLIGQYFGNGGVLPEVNCFNDHPALNENVTALNYEVGLKGQPFDFLQTSIAVFYTDYTDLPYQVSSTTGTGFSTESIIVDQTSKGIELENTFQFGSYFRVHTTFGYIDVDVDGDNPFAVAPLTPEKTASISPEFTIPTGGGELTLRADWSHRDDMYGEPSSDPGRYTNIDSRDLINFDISYRPADGDWSVAAYGAQCHGRALRQRAAEYRGLRPDHAEQRRQRVRRAVHEGILSLIADRTTQGRGEIPGPFFMLRFRQARRSRSAGTGCPGRTPS